MTVAELIEELKSCDPDLLVFVDVMPPESSLYRPEVIRSVAPCRVMSADTPDVVIVSSDPGRAS